MKYLLIIISLCGGFLIGQTQAQTGVAPQAMTLGTVGFQFSMKNNEFGKPSFLLDGKPFFPIVNWINSAVTVGDLQQFKLNGFNMLIMNADYVKIGTPHFAELMSVCSKLQLPVVLDYSPAEFFNLLNSQPGLGMKLPDGTPVQYPDFANPGVRDACRKRMKSLRTALAPFLHNPIVAISPFDSYDACHIPDGEVHYAFTVPPHPSGLQTLPFGEFALNQYRDYLQNRRGLSPASVGFTRWEEAFLPRNREEARNELHWRSWILYRRYYMTDFLQWISDLARQETGLPVALTLDVNFSISENWGTPSFEYAKPADFLIVYYYQLGLEPRARIQRLMEWVYTHCALQGKPMIGLLEVTSALDPPTSAEDYLRGSFPFVSGFALMDSVAGYQKVESRYTAFTQAATRMKDDLLTVRPPKATLALLMGTRDIYLNETISPMLQYLGIEYDIVYDVDLLSHPALLDRYKVLYLPRGQPQLKHDAEVSALLSKAKSEIIIDENVGDSLENHLAALAQEYALNPERVGWIKRLGSLLTQQSPPGMEILDFFKHDSQTLNDGWLASVKQTVAAGGGLRISKTDETGKGVKLRKSITDPFIVDWEMTAINGSPRLTLLPSDQGAGQGEISAGQDETGEIGVYVGKGWQRLGQTAIGKPVRYRLAVFPAGKNDLVGISISAPGLAKPIQSVFLSDRQNRRYIYLLWAGPKAAAQINNLRLQQFDADGSPESQSIK
jgi:hypothetical protein